MKNRRTRMIKLSLTAACCGLPVLIALACLAFSPTALAADGGLPNQNTAEGTGALSSLTTGANNTAAGFNALHSLAVGSETTATGSLALLNDISGYNTAYGFVPFMPIQPAHITRPLVATRSLAIQPGPITPPLAVPRF